jgi:3',5'-cyclic-nucleotide phosphodiesterase
MANGSESKEVKEGADTLDAAPTRKNGMAKFSSGVLWRRKTDESGRSQAQAPPSSKKRMSVGFAGRKGFSPFTFSLTSSLAPLPERTVTSGFEDFPPPIDNNTCVDSMNTYNDDLNAKPQTTGLEPQSKIIEHTRTRRVCIDANSLTMGLDDESADFLDFMTQAKCEEWLKSLCRRDPRSCIKTFFDDVARDGVDNIEEENGFRPDLSSPVLATMQRSSVFSVWRPTSVDSIRKMMTGEGTGKGLDIKGKSAKRGKLSAYVPFVQIHEDGHKTKIRALPRERRIRIFYKKREARDKAHDILSEVLRDMMVATDAAISNLIKKDKTLTDDLPQDRNVAVNRILVAMSSTSHRDLLKVEDANLHILREWEMDDPSITLINNYSPKCFGLDMPQRLFWEGYVQRGDISREPGSVYDTGRPSRPSFQDMNFASIKNKCEDDVPRAVVWQFTDPYLPPNEPDPDPMMPQTLLMAYEENGRVMPVVSDFDCFLLGTRGVRFQNPLPEEQVGLVHEMIRGVETILKDCKEGKTKNWTASWLNVMKKNKSHIPMPKYGFGDPKSYAIMKHAVQRLEEFGAVRHGAECFNFYFPQELDEEFLVIRGTGSNLPIPKYKYMKLDELQSFLSGCIDIGFTFPLNPKWVLCDSGWKILWDKLISSNHPNVQLSINAWYPPGSGLKECIETIHQQYPEGFSDNSGRKEGTQAWDEAELYLERYKRIQRAKRKLRCYLCFIAILQQTQKKVRARHIIASEEGERKITPGNMEVKSHFSTKSSHRAVSFPALTASKVSIDNLPTDDAIAMMSDRSVVSQTRAQSARCATFRGLSVQDDVEVIDSILLSVSTLSNVQKAGLQRIREQLVSPLRMNRFERRHTSFTGRSGVLPLMFNEVPDFILNEYGGVKDNATPLLKDQVTKVINAHRLLGASNNKCVEKYSLGENEYSLPVEWTTLDLDSKQSLADKLSFDALSRWDFDIIEVAKLSGGSPLFFVGWAIMGSPHAQQAMARDLGQDSRIEANGYDFIRRFSIPMPVLCSFFRTVEAHYLPNPYHNSTHAADVLQTLNAMLHLGGKEYISSQLDIFSLLVAAVVHDVGHPGLNNNFQIKTNSELAVQYNDVSVLENFSIAWLFKKLLGQARDFTIDIFSGLCEREFLKMRSIIIASILDTDMSHHFALFKRVESHREFLSGKTPDEWSKSYNTDEGRSLDPSIDLLCFLLHQADISNPAKPYPLFTFWTDRILAESYAQGDKEASLSMPKSPLCDRLTTDKKQCQIGFIKFVVLPSYQLLGDILPSFAKKVLPHLARSLEYWENYEEMGN